MLWQAYTTVETLSIIRWVEVIDQKEFAITVLDKDKEVFFVYVTSFFSFDNHHKV